MTTGMLSILCEGVYNYLAESRTKMFPLDDLTHTHQLSFRKIRSTGDSLFPVPGFIGMNMLTAG